MGSQLIERYRNNAEIYQDSDQCAQKSIELLQGLSLPKGLLPLENITEVGYNRENGFVWLKQKKPSSHFFKKIGKHVSYAAEVTAYVENKRMMKMTGVKSKELLIWITISNMYIDDMNSGKITFETLAGIGRSFPVTAFETEND